MVLSHSDVAVPGGRSVDPLDGLSWTPLGSKSRFRVTRGTQCSSVAPSRDAGHPAGGKEQT